MGSLVGSGPLEADGERRDRLAPVPAAEAQDDRGVEPAADVGDDRHIAAQPPLDGLLQRLSSSSTRGAGSSSRRS